MSDTLKPVRALLNQRSVSKVHIEQFKVAFKQGKLTSANINEPIDRGLPPLHLALLKGHEALVDILLAQARLEDEEARLKLDVNAREIQNQTALHLCITSQLSSYLKDFIALGGDIEAKDASGRTPLMVAATTGDQSAVMTLIEANAELETTDPTGMTALQLAVLSNKDEVVVALVSKKANVNCQDAEGTSPLQLAVLENNEAVVGYLIRNHCSLDHQDGAGNTALHLALEGQQAGIIERLRDAGADATLPNKQGVTATDLGGVFESARSKADLASEERRKAAAVAKERKVTEAREAVDNWLAEHNLSHLSDMLAEKNFKLAALLSVSEARLERIGMKKEDREALLAALHEDDSSEEDEAEAMEKSDKRTRMILTIILCLCAFFVLLAAYVIYAENGWKVMFPKKIRAPKTQQDL